MPEGSVEIHAPFVPTEETVSGEPTQDPGPEPTGPPEIVEAERPDVLAVLAPWVVGVERITIARAPAGAPIASISYAGPMAPHSLVLAPPEGSELESVWVVRGEIDQLGTVLSDGSTAGAQLVACAPPTGGGELELMAAAPTAPRCDLVEGLAVVTGADVALVWVPNPTITPIDLLGQGPPPDVVPPGTPGIAGGAFGDFIPRGGGGLGSCGTFSCTLAGGCSGVRFCTGGLLGPCVPNAALPELCDGMDNNCNGVADEGASASCNDGLDCTFDACDSTADPTGPAGCRNIPAPRALCLGAVRPGAPSCVTAVCNRPGLPPASTRAVSAFDTTVTPAAWGFTGAAPTGCSYFAGNSWCTNSYDSCSCDGPELCSPAVRMNAGCVGSPRGAPGTGGPTIYDPCDGDGLACTDDLICCEGPSGGYCRDDELLRAQPGGAELLAQRAFACGFGGPATYPLVPSYPPSFGSLTCAPAEFAVPAPFDQVCPNDGNPCTVEGCNEALGGACGPVDPDGGNPSFRDGAGPAETFVSGATVLVGPSCEGGPEGSFGCNPASCNDSPTCGNAPIAAGRGTPACFRRTDGSCLVARCDGMGACNPYFAVDPTFTCPSIPGCPGAGTCTAVVTPDSTDPNIPLGCRPPTGFCYYGPGQCVAAGTPTPDGCGVCAPNTNAWAPSPGPGPGTCPDDGNECTTDGCVGGACGHSWVPNGTGCTDDGDRCTIDICVAGACGHACNAGDPTCALEPACRPN
jgi:hypothetical protein